MRSDEFVTAFVDLKQRVNILENEVGAEITDSIHDVFLEDAQERLNNLEQFADPFDFHQLEQETHALKGSCGNIGANTMVAFCGELEKQSEANEAKI